ncbi:MAG: cob(I)yrinic acid a,c-diamide adenosyltransferase [Thermincola sp.]|jgi:cob(I)alamin adenosyltransferase|nr:cob(I)yrinic acid a,c-diamide adenosyltransferase [Thermincola sp.]MDT3704211.1 cob(I)yrinic acid a,c-diamide adenosyltransferase [Thermincola sp.]
MQKTKEFGLVQVFTGAGKGKTTASLGLAMRAIGHGFRVHMIQIMKGCGYSGELAVASKLWPLFTMSQFGRRCRHAALIKQGYKKCQACMECFVKDNGATAKDLDYVQLAVNEAEEFMKNKSCDILILDEIGNVLRYKMLTIGRVLDLIREKPSDMELILTGRGMPAGIIDAADMVTEMNEVKHPFNNGVGSRRGIEY